MNKRQHCAKKSVTTMLTYPCSGNNQSVGSSAPVVSRCFPGGYNVKLYISGVGYHGGYWLFCVVSGNVISLYEVYRQYFKEYISIG